MKRNRALIAVSVLACAALLMIAADAQEGAEMKNGPEVWGGPHVSMTKTMLGATFEFDCAQGNISQPIKPNATGEFTAAGTYTPERGGPVQKNSPLQEQPATYRGSISGDTMKLEITLNGQAPGTIPPLTLTRGKSGRVVKCR